MNGLAKYTESVNVGKMFGAVARHDLQNIVNWQTMFLLMDAKYTVMVAWCLANIFTAGCNC